MRWGTNPFPRCLHLFQLWSIEGVFWEPAPPTAPLRLPYLSWSTYPIEKLYPSQKVIIELSVIPSADWLKHITRYETTCKHHERYRERSVNMYWVQLAEAPVTSIYVPPHMGVGMLGNTVSKCFSLTRYFFLKCRPGKSYPCNHS